MFGNRDLKSDFLMQPLWIHFHRCYYLTNYAKDMITFCTKKRSPALRVVQEIERFLPMVFSRGKNDNNIWEMRQRSTTLKWSILFKGWPNVTKVFVVIITRIIINANDIIIAFSSSKIVLFNIPRYNYSKIIFRRSVFSLPPSTSPTTIMQQYYL